VALPKWGGPSFLSSMSQTVTVGILVDEIQQEMRNMKTFKNVDKKGFRALLRKRVKAAQKEVMKDAKAALKSDPRAAARAVKMSIYKKIIGANISILPPKNVTYIKVYTKKRKLRPGQVGGNRMPVKERTQKIDSYFGSSRAFILNFVNSGTKMRRWRTVTNRTVNKGVGRKHTSASLEGSRNGNRGKINPTSWFETSGPKWVEVAANQISEDLVNSIVDDFNGGFNLR